MKSNACASRLLILTLLFLPLGRTNARAQHPTIEFSPNSVDFEAIGKCAGYPEREIFLVNRGSTGVDVVIPSSGTGPFWLSAPDEVVSIGPGDSAEILVRFVPMTSGSYSDTIRVTAMGSETTAALHVQGTMHSTGYTLSPGTWKVDLPDWQEGSSADTTFSFRNAGTQELTIVDVSASNPFTTVSASLPHAIASGEEFTIGVRFSPDREGKWTSRVRVSVAYGGCVDTIQSVLLGSAGVSSGVAADPEHAWGTIDFPHPNPAVDVVLVPLELYQSEEILMEVIDAIGRRVALLHNGRMKAGIHHIEWQPQHPGSFMVRLIREGETTVLPVVVVQ